MPPDRCPEAAGFDPKLIEIVWALHATGKWDESRLKMGELILEKAASNLIDEIKKLSRQDQAAIVVEVLGTLDAGGEEFDDEELLHELQRRESEGMDGSVSWSALRDMP